MTFKKPDSSFWNAKLAVYLHDPFDKALQIKGHETRAQKLREAFGVDADEPPNWKKADGLAAGFERGTLPGYDSDENSSGFVDFTRFPVLTHPVSEKGRLEVDLSGVPSAEAITDAVCAEVRSLLGDKAGKGIGAAFFGDHEGLSRARFLYAHLLLRFKLAEDNVGGLGALWHRMPADTRFPDHSIWQHNALASAFYSTMEMEGSEKGIGMMACSITPVQSFIARARKLRDYWTGSVILSRLAFEGIRWVIENLGPDHVLYPSLIDQPLVAEYLTHSWKVDQTYMPKALGQQPDIASFPNKFIFVVPVSHAAEIAGEIEKSIRGWWRRLYEDVRAFACDRAGCKGEEAKLLGGLFERQCADYWDFSWSAVRLAGSGDIAELAGLLPESGYKDAEAIAKLFSKLLEEKKITSAIQEHRGLFYSTSHSLLQAALASGKSGRAIRRGPEPGEKCRQCGEFESLHVAKDGRWESAREYTDAIKSFWERLRASGDIGPNELDEGEHLCSLCLVKRLAYRVAARENSHLLAGVFGGYDSFPTTTQMALHGYFRRNGITSPKEMRDIANSVHTRDDDTAPRELKGRLESVDRYYAILLMDGDYVGKLVNGETISALWNTAMHPEMAARLKKESFDKAYHECWEKIFNGKTMKYRRLTPAVHAAISESLGDFSLYGVASIVKKHHGRLIYAGGDDVCAVMPVQTSLAAAREIRQYYNSMFRFVSPDGGSAEAEGKWKPLPGKLSVNLGKGRGGDSNDISISAGILVCHHKESLTEMIASAHRLLENEAKEKGGRNCCAIELRKRSGGSRFARAKWDDSEYWGAFSLIADMAVSTDDENRLSSSLAYRLEQFGDGIRAIARLENPKDLLDSFFTSLLEKSLGKESKSTSKLASAIRALTVRPGQKEPFNNEPLLVALYLAKGGIHG